MPNSSRPADHVRPYGDDAPWNVASDTLATHPESDNLVELLWNDAPDRPGNFNLGFDGYTYPVYYAADATGTYTVDTPSWTNLDGEEMPWNPAWNPAPGSDAQVIVLDPETGREWNLWQVSFDGDVISASNGNLIPGNYLTNVDGFGPSRGVGIPYYAMLVQPEEIAAGEIAHALSMPIRNSAPQFVAPGTKSDGNTGGGIPMGTRFELTVTDAEIDAWIESLPDQLPESTVSSARVIAEALNDYGWFITDSSGAATWQFEARTSAGDLWNDVGLGETSVEWKEFPRDLMDGLLTPDRIRAIVPSDEYGSAPSQPPSDPPDTSEPTPDGQPDAQVVASFTFPDFADVSDLNLNGDAAQVGDVLRLTSASFKEAGSAFMETALPVDGDTSFQTEFDFRLHSGTGADGFTFLLQSFGDSESALGNPGGSLGYDNEENGYDGPAIRKSMAIEFDTYKNPWDDNANHVAVVKNGNVTNHLAAASPEFDLNGGDTNTAWVDYDGASNLLEVYVSNTGFKPSSALIAMDFDLTSVLGASALVGFTGATGGLNDAQDIESWTFEAASSDFFT